MAGLLVIAHLTDRAGVFERMARHVARAAGGDGRRLLVGVYVIGLFVTVWLSLDTTAVILAPIVYSLTRLLGVAPLPFVFATTYVANTASLFLPVSNLTNLGPNLTVIGSLATMLSLSIIGKKGLKTPAFLYFKVGLISVPLLLLAAVLGLWLTL